MPVTDFLPVPKISSATHMARAVGLSLALAGLAISAPAAADPKGTYTMRCGMCHQASADGLPGQFPRLSGRTAQMAQKPEGRQYLARVMLWGLHGAIEADGKPMNGVMPGMSGVKDDQLAEALNYTLTLGKSPKVAPFKAEEIAAVRAQGRVSGIDNNNLRKTLVASGVIK